MAISKFPRLVSMTVAVVKTREYPLIFPPTMMEAPTSEMTPPNPAMTAANKGKSRFLDQDPYHLEPCCPEGQNLKAEFWGKLLDGCQGNAHHDGSGNHCLGKDHGCRCVEDFQKAERPVPPEKDRDKKANNDGRKAHSRIDKTYNDLLPGKPGKGDRDSSRYPDQQADEGG